MNHNSLKQTYHLLFLAAALVLFLAPYSYAHCDTYDGPVVKDAQAALQSGDVTPILKWVKPEFEPQIRAQFEKTLSLSKLSPEAKEMAESYFFETLVRLHREGEGAPYTGLKPAGTPLEPGIEAAEAALLSAADETLINDINAELAEGIRIRLHDALEKKEHAGHNVEAGRDYVAAYIEFIHYVERLHQDISAPAAHHEGQTENVEHKH